jgi:hypothetical protein
MYLVAESRDRENPFVLYKVVPKRNVPDILRNTLHRKLEWIAGLAGSGDVKVKDFLDIHRTPGDILVVKAEIVKEFQSILAIMNQKPNLPLPPNIKELEKIWGWAIEFDIRNARLIYFRKHSDIRVIGKADERGKWPAELSDGKLTDLEGNILTFDDQIDSIYFESLDSMIVPPPHHRFETMFDFRDFYKRETTKALKALKGKILLIEDDLIPRAAEKPRTAQRITKLSQSGIFKDIENGKITTYFFSASKKVIGDDMTYGIIDEKLGVENMAELDSFVDACMCKYLRAPAGYSKDEDPQIFVSEYKHLYERVRRAT